MLGRHFTKEIVLVSPAAAVHQLFRAPWPCKVLAVRAIRTGGTGAVVKAQANTDDLLTGNLSLGTANWTAGSLVATDATLRLVAGDALKAEVVSVAGSPTGLTIQVDLVMDADVN